MNWKKIFVNLGVASVVGGLTPYLQAVASGQHVAFTAANTLVPIGLVAMKSLLALFQTPPNAAPAEDGSQDQPKSSAAAAGR